MHTDSCNSYLIRSGDEAILIDCGMGTVKRALREIGVKRIAWILHTHPDRDMVLGDREFVAAGTRIAVPKETEEYFSHAEERWQTAHTYVGVGYGPGFNLPLRDIPVARTLNGGDTFEWKDLSLRVIDTPGHTRWHKSFALKRDGKTLIFSGDVIHSSGRLWEVDALQGNYEAFIKMNSKIMPARRLPELLDTIDRLRTEAPDMLLPAHGDPIRDCDAALAQLKDNLLEMIDALQARGNPNMKRVNLPEVQVYPNGSANFLIQADNGHAVLFDTSFENWNQTGLQNRWINERPGLKTVDIVIPSHFHGDHTARCNAFVDHFGSQIYVHEEMKEILQQPHRFFRPCLLPNAIKVDRTFKDGESFEWNDWKFTFYHFPGQTWWHQATLAEHGDLRLLFTGDSVDRPGHIRCIDTWNYNLISDTEGAARCAEVLEITRPTHLAMGHWGIIEYEHEYTEKTRQWVKTRNAALCKIIAQPDANMGYDVYWTHADPFRTVIDGGQSFKLQARVRNHLPTQSLAEVSLTVPKGWTVSPASAGGPIEPRSEGQFEFTITVPQNAKDRRYMLGIVPMLNGRIYGELAMAVVDVGGCYDIERIKPSKPWHQNRYGYFS